MLVEGLDVTRAALEVGYESTSQFTREYKRLFGNRRCATSRRFGPPTPRPDLNRFVG